MKYVISGKEFKKVDQFTIREIGIPSLVLMERAALAVAEEVISFADLTHRIGVVCGTGNNGADGVAAARILHNRGYHTCVYIFGKIEKATEELKKQISIYENIGGTVIYDAEQIEGDIIIDAVFGIGLSRTVEGLYRNVIEQINRSSAKVVSVDVPSGIHADTGAVMGIAVRADMTVTFGLNKTGMIFYPGADHAGRIVVKEIGFPETAFAGVEYYKVIESSDYSRIPPRVNDSNKGTYGKLLVIAGKDDMSGAAFMCAKAGLRMGTGMVKILTTKGNETLLKTMLPEAMVTVYGEEDYEEKLSESFRWCDVIAVGPGIGTGDLQAEIVAHVLKSELPCVIDADGINCLSENESLKKLLHSHVIITPHVGEMARFSQMQVRQIKDNLIATAVSSAVRYGITVVLKDARTVISNGKEVYLNTSGNNGMATAGSGDVLTGITAAMLAKKIEPVLAAALAVHIHGCAGDIAAKRLSKTSLIATDIIEELVELTKKIEM